ncbi:ABC transporter permease [Sedimenticola hydrogenitrophicus]|uniref:ABC transporter permease n=1 Tax=Sedimenticola hydrogenitrophicus TaxID=2967975 RepID=UPI0023B19E15|nr:ABC transporter permease [Sedimenticola hydrogenitrophicus]
MALPIYATPFQRAWHYTFRFICGLVLLFLMAPILVIVPLSFNAEPYFSFTQGMLSLDSAAYSLRWYEDFFSNKMWLLAVKNSIYIGVASTCLATVLGTLAALGLSRQHMPYRGTIMGLLISPMIVPLIITAAGIYFFYARLGLAGNLWGLILAHTVLGTPFVVITVTATLSGFDISLIRAGLSLGASHSRIFFKVIMPLILPGVISGALFAFGTSFDEVVVVLFLSGAEQTTIPRQMWSGIREQISPTILAVATLLVALSILMLTTIELLRRRSERLRGQSPG